MFTSLCQFGLGVAVAFSGNYYFFVVLRFLLAMVSLACVCATYIVQLCFCRQLVDRGQGESGHWPQDVFFRIIVYISRPAKPSTHW